MGGEVILCDDAIVHQGNRLHAGQDKVLTCLQNSSGGEEWEGSVVDQEWISIVSSGTQR